MAAGPFQVVVSSTCNSAVFGRTRPAAAAASPALNAAASAPERDGARVAGEEQHRLGRQIAAGGAGGRAELVVRVEHERRAPETRDGLGPGGAFLRAHVPFVNVLADGLAGDGLAGQR